MKTVSENFVIDFTFGQEGSLIFSNTDSLKSYLNELYQKHCSFNKITIY